MWPCQRLNSRGSERITLPSCPILIPLRPRACVLLPDIVKTARALAHARSTSLVRPAPATPPAGGDSRRGHSQKILQGRCQPTTLSSTQTSACSGIWAGQLSRQVHAPRAERGARVARPKGLLQLPRSGQQVRPFGGDVHQRGAKSVCALVYASILHAAQHYFNGAGCPFPQVERVAGGLQETRVERPQPGQQHLPGCLVSNAAKQMETNTKNAVKSQLTQRFSRYFEHRYKKF